MDFMLKLIGFLRQAEEPRGVREAAVRARFEERSLPDRPGGCGGVPEAAGISERPAISQRRHGEGGSLRGAGSISCQFFTHFFRLMLALH